MNTDTAPAASPTVLTPSSAQLLHHQLRFELRAARRNPTLLGFTLAMPLMMLGIFGTLIGEAPMGPWDMTYKEYLVPNMVVLGLLAGSFVSLGSTIATRRGTGELKRVRGTPLPPWVALAAMVIQSALLGVVTAAAVILCGQWWFAVAPPAIEPLLALLTISTFSLSVLGIVVASFIHKPENATPVTNVVLWPVAFISGTFTWVPPWSIIGRVAHLLPVHHLNDAALSATSVGDRHIDTPISVSLAVAALWGVLGAAVALRRFRWSPSASSAR